VIGFPLLLAMPAEGAAGGVAAHAALTEALRVAMVPLLRPGAVWAPPDRLTRCHADGTFGGKHRNPMAGANRAVMRMLMGHRGMMHGMWDDEDEEEEEEDEASDSDEDEPQFGCLDFELPPDSAAIDPVTQQAHPGVTRLINVAATWDKGALAAMLDFSHLRTPALAPSATADADGDAVALRESHDDTWCRTAARAMLLEVNNATRVDWSFSSTVGPPMHGRPAGTYFPSVPRLRYVASLAPDDAGAPGGTGVLTLKLFALRAGVNVPGDPCRALFEADPFNASMPRYDEDAAMRLVETLDALWTADSPAHSANAAQWRALERAHAADARVCTLPGLLSAVEAQERPEAPQPPGLTVQLRPYQRQSLRFMLDAEQGVSREAFWAERTLADGTKAYYSKMLSRITLQAPKTLRGGLLCEEMGLVRPGCLALAHALC
jgi:hypothetical protein